jgi:hypothetical protein
MRISLLLSWASVTFVTAIPGGGRDGHGPPGHEYGKPNHVDYEAAPAYEEDCTTEPAPVHSTPEPVYTKPVQVYTKSPEPVYTKPPKANDYPKPSPTFTCPTTCRLEYHGTFLQYPTVIVYTSVYSQTINAFVTEFGDGSPGQSVEETITAPDGAAPAPLTWTAFGVEL